MAKKTKKKSLVEDVLERYKLTNPFEIELVEGLPKAIELGIIPDKEFLQGCLMKGVIVDGLSEDWADACWEIAEHEFGG